MERVCPFCGADIPDLPPGTPGDTLECPVCGQTQDRAVQPVPEPARAGAPQNPEAPPPLPPAAAAGVDPASFNNQVLPPDLDLEAPPIPWEGDRGFFRSLFGTIGQVLFHPGQAFAAPGRPGLAWPLAYALILGTLGLGGILVLDYLAGVSPFTRQSVVWLVVFSPLITLVIQFLSSVICHLCLMIVGGNKRGFQPTFRVVAYATTSDLWLLFPWIGIIPALVWDIVIGTVGLSKAHGISRTRAFFAWVLPLLVVLAVGILAFAMAAGRMMGEYRDIMEIFR